VLKVRANVRANLIPTVLTRVNPLIDVRLQRLPVFEYDVVGRPSGVEVGVDVAVGVAWLREEVPDGEYTTTAATPAKSRLFFTVQPPPTRDHLAARIGA
jgi:hypothetical protein